MTALLGAVRERLADRAGEAADPRVVVGERLLAVELVDPDHGPLVGLAHRPPGTAAFELEFEFEGQTVADLVAGATAAESPPRRAAGVAALNALSVPDVDWRRGDPMAGLPADVKRVATVGLFRPTFATFDDVTVWVVERDPPDPTTVETPSGVAVETYAPDECDRAFAGADVCFLTGSTLVYGGTERYLLALAEAGVSPVVLVGATASHRPEPAFAAGVDVVAGARVTDRERALAGVSGGGCGTDLHGHGVEKVYVTASGREPRGLAVGGGETDRAETDGAYRGAERQP